MQVSFLHTAQCSIGICSNVLVWQEALPRLSNSLLVLAENVFRIQRLILFIAGFIPVTFLKELAHTYIMRVFFFVCSSRRKRPACS